MGRETNCTARHQNRSSPGKLLLETDDLQFRGEFRLRIPLQQIQLALVENGELSVVWSGGEASFELGSAAEKWADSLNNPKSLLDKLGVKPEHTVSVINVRDEGFLSDLQRRSPQTTIGKTVQKCDIIFLQADEPKELKALDKLARQIQLAGAIWVITPKKRPEIADTVVMKAGRAAGLVDVKVARFSETYTALKFVVPRDRR